MLLGGVSWPLEPAGNLFLPEGRRKLDHPGLDNLNSINIYPVFQMSFIHNVNQKQHNIIQILQWICMNVVTESDHSPCQL